MKDLTVLTDDKLVSLYARGNNDAFDILLQRYECRIFSYILNIVKDEDQANDIFQDTFIKAIVTIKDGRYTESGKFGSWLTRIAHNLVIDYYRQEKAVPQVSCDNEEINILNRKELSDTNIEDCLIKDQILLDIRSLVSSLPALQKEVLEMRYYMNMSFKEIAETTGVGQNALRHSQPTQNCRRKEYNFDAIILLANC